MAKAKIKFGWHLCSLWIVVLGGIFLTACSGAVETPSPASPTPEPTLTPTTAPPTALPTETPTAAPTNTPRPKAQISFEWDVGGVRPSDADDVSAIVADLTRKEGILSGYGNEQGLTLEYDPTLITVEEIQEILENTGHPVTVRQ